MVRVSEIMIKEFVYCSPMSTMDESKVIMDKYGCTKIPVVDKNKMIIGAVCKSDLSRNVHNVVECMTRNLKAVEVDSTIDECLKIMILNNIEQVPVIDKQGHYCGIVTEKELLKSE